MKDPMLSRINEWLIGHWNCFDSQIIPNTTKLKCLLVHSAKLQLSMRKYFIFESCSSVNDNTILRITMLSVRYMSILSKTSNVSFLPRRKNHVYFIVENVLFHILSQNYSKVPNHIYLLFFSYLRPQWSMLT